MTEGFAEPETIPPSLIDVGDLVTDGDGRQWVADGSRRWDDGSWAIDLVPLPGDQSDGTQRALLVSPGEKVEAARRIYSD